MTWEHFPLSLKCPNLVNQCSTLINRVLDTLNNVNSLDINPFVSKLQSLIFLHYSMRLNIEVNSYFRLFTVQNCNTSGWLLTSVINQKLDKKARIYLLAFTVCQHPMMTKKKATLPLELQFCYKHATKDLMW